MRWAFWLLLIPLAGAAQAHDWYDNTCCSDKDCRPIEDNEVKESPQGWLTPMGWVGYGDRRVKDSRDGRYHICATQRLICFYVPPRGM